MYPSKERQCKLFLLQLVLIVAILFVVAGSWYFMQGKQTNYIHQELWHSLEYLTNKMDAPNPTPWPLKLSRSNQLSFHDEQIAPVILKMSNFSATVKTTKTWISNKFFAFAGGFKSCIKIDVANHNNSNDGHVIVGLHKVDGPYDADLKEKYSLGGVFTLELLNQWNDTNHHTNKSACTCVSLPSLSCDISWNIPSDIILQYVVNDSVYFRVSYDHLSSILWSHFIGDIGWTVVGYIAMAMVFSVCKRLLRKDSISFSISFCVCGIVIIGGVLGGIVWIVIMMLLTPWMIVFHEGFVFPVLGRSKNHHKDFIYLMNMYFIINSVLARIYVVDLLSKSEIILYLV